AAGEASRAWLRMSTRAASAACIQRAAPATAPATAASARIAVAANSTPGPETIWAKYNDPSPAPPAARSTAKLPRMPIQPGCDCPASHLVQRRAPSVSATISLSCPVLVRANPVSPYRHYVTGRGRPADCGSDAAVRDAIVLSAR